MALADRPVVPVEETLAALGVSPARGLSVAEVEARLGRYGPNEVTEEAAHPVARFLSKFWGLSAWMLELIMALSWALRKYSDLLIVSGLLVVNAVVSFLQERRAAGAVDLLRQRLRVTARVLRDGTWQLVPARQLVPGDIVRLRPGDFVPADTTLLAGELAVDQAALTGESLETDRRPGEPLYSGSVVRRGEGTGVVVLTGARTYFGRTTDLVQHARPKLHVEDVVARVVRWLFVIVGSLLGLAFVVAVLRGLPLVEIVPLMLVLLLSAVPVALPVMFTVSMAVGSMELAKRGVLVTRLSAAEDAATMDVLCVDKTGTLTENRLTIVGVVPASGHAEAEVLLYGALASQEANQDPIDQAFLAAARSRRLLDGPSAFVPVGFTPFDATTRRTEAIVEADGRRVRAVKGAVAAVAEASGLDAATRAETDARARAQAEQGHRVLAVARGPEPGPLELLGLVALSDPPRPDAKPLITALGGLGVAVKVLTGDALPVAREVARILGLARVRRVADLTGTVGSDAGRAAELAADTDGFAEVYPEDKYRVVQALQAARHVVGMTGDGVNDAPAMRQAEVGIAVSNATDVAKAAASVVLTTEGLSGIVTLVEQGRMVYQRVVTWVINKVSRTILKAGFVAIAFLVTGKFVVSAFAMILLVFLTDFAKIALATDRVRGSRRPETWELTGLVRVAVVLGVLMIVEALGLLAVGWRAFGLGGDDAALRTFCFQTLFYLALFSILSIRERRAFWASRPSRTLAAVLVLDALVGTLVSVAGLPGLEPLPWPQTLGVFVYAMIVSLGLNDWLKVTLIRRYGGGAV